MRNYDFSRYTRSLLHSDLIHESPIMTLNGYHMAMKLEKKNIKTIGDLYNIFQKVEYKEEAFEDCLRIGYNIYSKYGLSNMIKHMKVIKHLREN